MLRTRIGSRSGIFEGVALYMGRVKAGAGKREDRKVIEAALHDMCTCPSCRVGCDNECWASRVDLDRQGLVSMVVSRVT
jgi:hypothetical protein